jgi:hypothetical protein
MRRRIMDKGYELHWISQASNLKALLENCLLFVTQPYVSVKHDA